MGAIDGTHIPLSSRPQRNLTPMPSDFFNREKIHSVLLQAVCDLERIFRNVCIGQPCKVYDVGQFAWSKIYM